MTPRYAQQHRLKCNLEPNCCAYLGVIILQPHASTQRFRLRILRRTRSFPGRTSARSLSGRIESIWETPSKERAVPMRILTCMEVGRSGRGHGKGLPCPLPLLFPIFVLVRSWERERDRNRNGREPRDGSRGSGTGTPRERVGMGMGASCARDCGCYQVSFHSVNVGRLHVHTDIISSVLRIRAEHSMVSQARCRTLRHEPFHHDA